MKDVDRRSALAFGLAATSAIVMTESAMAQGTEIAPGVRRVDLGTRELMISRIQDRLDARRSVSAELQIDEFRHGERHGLPLPRGRIAGQPRPG